MCGLCGIWNANAEVSESQIRRMTAAIAHRGPDGEGVMVSGGTGIGHRRLSILDLSERGAQPMQEDRFVLSYNGEIYNYKDLRNDLETKGITFFSSGDTEVLLKGLIHEGEAFIPKINGMFAFAFFNKDSNELLLARDRYGVKPLYYSIEGEECVFGSEIKAITASGKRNSKLDHEGMLEYFTFQNFFTDRTLIKGIRMLPAGSWLKLEPNQPEKLERYWDYKFQEPEMPRSDFQEVAIIEL